MEMSGKVARVNGRGFGFVKGDDAREWFFHAGQVRRVGFDALQVGDAVTLEIDPHGKRGPCAVNVAPADGSL